MSRGSRRRRSRSTGSRRSELGVSPMDVADTVTAAIGGMNVGKFKSEGERYDIAVRFLETGGTGWSC